MVKASSSTVLTSSSPTRARNTNSLTVCQPTSKVIQPMKPSGTKLNSATTEAKRMTEAWGKRARSRSIPATGRTIGLS